ncbi:hypothetical protein B7463_g1273, partial [Scytalidium lignicola]
MPSFNSTLFCSIALLFLCSFNYGFSDQAFASTQATTAFTRQFGVFNPKTKKYALSALYLSLLNSLKAGTQLVGVLIGSWISKHYGRRWYIFAMNIYALGSTAVIVSGTNNAQMLTGRSIHYVYLGMQLAVIPVFLAEISPAHFRGSMGVLYWLSIKRLANPHRAVLCDSRDDDPACVAHPRALCHIFQALKLPVLPPAVTSLAPPQRPSRRRPCSLTRLRQTKEEKRKGASTPASATILAEFTTLSNAIHILGNVPRPVPRIRHFLSIFSSANRNRTIIVVLLLFFQQSTGQSFASQYGMLFVKALHNVNPFSVALGTNAVDIGGILLCMLLADRLGRKPILIISAFLQTVSLFTMDGLGTADSSNTTAKAGIVAMLLLYSFGWSCGYAPLAYVVAAELPSPYLREYTLRVAYTVKLVMEFVISFTYPYLEDQDEANLGGRLGFIYGSIAFCGLIFSIFLIPETKNLELEEMDEKFGKGMLNVGKEVDEAVDDQARNDALSLNEQGMDAKL